MSMGTLKALFKLALLLTLAAAVAGVVVLVKRNRASGPVTYDEWPAVPTNPERESEPTAA